MCDLEIDFIGFLIYIPLKYTKFNLLHLETCKLYLIHTIHVGIKAKNMENSNLSRFKIRLQYPYHITASIDTLNIGFHVTSINSSHEFCHARANIYTTSNYKALYTAMIILFFQKYVVYIKHTFVDRRLLSLTTISDISFIVYITLK